MGTYVIVWLGSCDAISSNIAECEVRFRVPSMCDRVPTLEHQHIRYNISTCERSILCGAAVWDLRRRGYIPGHIFYIDLLN